MNTPSMFRNRFRRKKSEPKCYEDIHHSCTVRFLDDSQPITVTFQVSRGEGRHLHLFFKVKVDFLKYTHSKEHGNCFKIVLHLLIYLN